jgi:hypothetical protein
MDMDTKTKRSNELYIGTEGVLVSCIVYRCPLENVKMKILPPTKKQP